MLLKANRRWVFALLAILAIIWTSALLYQQKGTGSLPWSRFNNGRTYPTPSKQHGSSASHGKAASGPFAFSIKVVAYVFPQFHPIPENDKNWGVNFTDWDNVKRVTHNNYGLETLRPAEDIGFYNLLDRDVRARYARLIRDMGFYGIVYHHYWFHYPVMEKVPEAILHDGEPGVPFMLSWANEPWTATWDGSELSKVILAQDYGDLEHWRVHFDWLLPYFQHPLYIRVDGRPQFMIYNPAGLGDVGIHMFAAFRRWALEAGLPGLDIIETRVQPEGANNRGLSDAMSEFLFRSGSGLDGTEWANFNRVSKVYHRGASVTWDNTPRYGERGTANIFAHPTLWKMQMLYIIRRMKLEPNPIGEENFFFINALNEWGEGNVLEPSVQWGDGFSKAAREMVDAEKTLLPWRDQVIDAGLHTVTATAKAANAGTPIDVCVLVPMLSGTARFSEPDTASELFDSLIAQTNPQWRAVAFRASPNAADAMACKKHVLDTYDPRILYADDLVPQEVLGQDMSGRGLSSTQHVLAHLGDLSPACAGARYLLVASEDGTYAPETFELVQSNGAASALRNDAGSKPDIIGLNYMTNQTLATALLQTSSPAVWDRYCTRLDDGSVDTCSPATLRTAGQDLVLSATLLDMAKTKALAVSGALLAWASGSRTPDATPDQAILENMHKEGWSWVVSSHKKGMCDFVAGHTYKSCGRTGRIWLDMPSEQTTYASQCLGLHAITKAHGWLVNQWDMETWRKNPFCLRLSQERYAELFAAPTTPAASTAPAS